eukprot:m51a1_g3390 hypothetical protein (204) ;mRNA; r:512868-514385
MYKGSEDPVTVDVAPGSDGSQLKTAIGQTFAAQGVPVSMFVLDLPVHPVLDAYVLRKTVGGREVRDVQPQRPRLDATFFDVLQSLFEDRGVTVGVYDKVAAVESVPQERDDSMDAYYEYMWTRFVPPKVGPKLEMRAKNPLAVTAGAPGTGKSCLLDLIATDMAGHVHSKIVRYKSGAEPCPGFADSDRIDEFEEVMHVRCSL